ncbi:MAG: glycosyltransferase [Verrucomicrobiota bacterium]
MDSDNSRIRIAHIHAGKKMCGCAAYIFNLMEYMDATRFESHLTLLEEGEVSEAAEARGLPYFVAGKSKPGDPGTFLRLRKYYIDNCIDIAHTHTLNGNFYGRVASLLSPGTKIVTTVHTYMKKVIGDIAGKRMLLGRLMLAQNKILSMGNAAFVVASEDLRQDIMSDGVPEQKSHIVYNGIRLPSKSEIPLQRSKMREAFSFSQETLVIGTAIRLVPSKNVQALIRGSAALKKAGIPHKNLIIGEGGEAPKLRELVEELGLQEEVVFAGWRADARSLVAGLDLYVQPSLEENFPYGILEAMAMERPVLCYNTGSHPDMVESGKTGYVCEHGNQEEFERRLVELMTHHERRLTFGTQSRQRVQNHFTDDGMAAAMATVYETVVSAKSAMNPVAA